MSQFLTPCRRGIAREAGRAWVPSRDPVVGLREIDTRTIYPLPDPRRTFTLGYDPDGNDVVVPDDGISRNHCIFSWRGDELWLQDMSSMNGTWVNGARVGRSPVVDGDLLLVGRTTLVAFSESSRHRRTMSEWLVGTDPAFRAAAEQAAEAVLSGSGVVILGERGCGWSLLASAIHEVGCGPEAPAARIECGVDDVVPEAAAPKAAPLRERLAARCAGGLVYIHDLDAQALPAQRQIVGSVIDLAREGVLRFVIATTQRLEPRLVPLEIPVMELPGLRNGRGEVAYLVDHFCRESAVPASG